MLYNGIEKNVIFTISSLNYLHYALTVRSSFLKHNSNYSFVIFIVDEIQNKEILDEIRRFVSEGVDIRFLGEIKSSVPEFSINEFVIKYNITEANTAIKPYCMKYFFNKGYSKVIYIDPDIKFYSSISKLDRLFSEYDVIMTPHMTSPYPDDEKMQNAQVIMQAGIYNCGFIAAKNTVNGNNLASFWAKQLYAKCFIDPHNGLFTDQKWADWFPSLFDKVHILKDQGYNAAYWNLHERKIFKKEDAWYANDDELVFYHFSGLNKNETHNISRHQNRYCLSDFADTDLSELFCDYVDDVNSRKADVFASTPYYFNYIPSTSIEIKDRYRVPFAKKLSKYKVIMYASDPSRKFRTVFTYAKILYRNYRISNLFELLLGYREKKAIDGVNLIGYFDEAHSIGEVGRNFIRKMYATGIAFALYNIESGASKIPQVEQAEFAEYMVKKLPYMNNVFIVNADALPVVYKNRPELFKGRHNAGIWFWEFETGFQKYAPAHKYLDEVIVYSDHVLKGISGYLPKDCAISKKTYPFDGYDKELIPSSEILDKYGISDGGFRLFFNFDYNSSYDRKNPEAILYAYAKAFANIADVSLIIKTSNEENSPENREKLQNLILNLNLSGKIRLVSEILSKNEMLSLINACDAYISLHRAEGLGLGMMDAMNLGKPVIATNYGGNTDFMTTKNSIPINYKMVKANTTFDAYRDVEEWAEADIDQAADALLMLYNNENLRKSIGEEAKSDIAEKYADQKFQLELYDSFSQWISKTKK